MCQYGVRRRRFGVRCRDQMMPIITARACSTASVFAVSSPLSLSSFAALLHMAFAAYACVFRQSRLCQRRLTGLLGGYWVCMLGWFFSRFFTFCSNGSSHFLPFSLAFVFYCFVALYFPLHSGRRLHQHYCWWRNHQQRLRLNCSD